MADKPTAPYWRLWADDLGISRGGSHAPYAICLDLRGAEWP
jgi:hypothetical protein